jgi:hypothetical protein
MEIHAFKMTNLTGTEGASRWPPASNRVIAVGARHLTKDVSMAFRAQMW